MFQNVSLLRRTQSIAYNEQKVDNYKEHVKKN